MGIFIRGVITGFAFNLGSALFKKVSKELGFEDEKETSNPEKAAQTDNNNDGAVDSDPADSSQPAVSVSGRSEVDAVLSI